MIELPIWITTDRFEVTTPSDHFINPRCFGEDFAKWLAPRLESNGLPTSDPLQEDWGWLLLVDHAGFRFGLSIGVMEASLGVVPADWRVGVEYSRFTNSLRHWFKPEPFELLQDVAARVRSILEAEPAFRLLEREP